MGSVPESISYQMGELSQLLLIYLNLGVLLWKVKLMMLCVCVCAHSVVSDSLQPHGL